MFHGKQGTEPKEGNSFRLGCTRLLLGCTGNVIKFMDLEKAGLSPRSLRSFDLGLPGGKPIGVGSVKLKVVRYVFVLLLGLVFGFVLQSASMLVKAVDNFSRSSENAGFSP